MEINNQNQTSAIETSGFIDSVKKGEISNTIFEELNALKFKGGLPIFTTVPTHTGIDGEFVLYKDTAGSDYRLYVYLDGAWKKVGDIDFLTTAGGLNNVVEDTTPQAGGDFDMNDFGLTDKGGAVRRYAIDKSLSDNTSTAVFSVDSATTNSIFIRLYYNISLFGSTRGAILGYETIAMNCIPNTSSGSHRNQEYEINMGSAVMDTSGLKSVSITNNKKLTFSIGCNNDENQTMDFVGLVEIVATGGNYTFTEE
jgi:hypothetical protein